MQRQAQRWRQERRRIAFVPTMGYLHEGHMSLVREARKAVGSKGRVVVSIYVNPTQFGPSEDFKRYPRDLKHDQQLCKHEGVDIVFTPHDSEIYPRNFSTYVVEEALSKPMEGQARPGHFRGVATVVAKLFNIVQPDIAVFGAKDFQQAAVIERMVRDLNFSVKLIIAPTVREQDGLAMSSRNKYLAGEARTHATALQASIEKARALVRIESQIPAADLKRRLHQYIETQPTARVDYIEFFDPSTLQPVDPVRKGTHMALAVSIANIRLIDNARL